MIIILSALVAIGSGIVVLQTNVRRLLNQIFFAYSLAATVWFITVYRLSKSEGFSSEVIHELFWRRLNSWLAAFSPWFVWLLKESVRVGEVKRLRVLTGSWPWVVLGFILVRLSYHDSFIYV